MQVNNANPLKVMAQLIHLVPWKPDESVKTNHGDDD